MDDQKNGDIKLSIYHLCYAHLSMIVYDKFDFKKWVVAKM
jgi:hypothetical protein